MFPPMPMLNHESDPDFLAILSERLHAIISACGLKRTIDANHRAPRSSPLSSMFALDAAAIEELKSDEWDDRPAIEKIFHVMISSANAPRRAPEPFTARILTHLPDTCTIAVMLAISFTPVVDGEESDLSKVGRWSVALRDVGGQVTGSNTTRNWQGDILDRQELQDALEGVQAACARYRDAYKLKPIRQRDEGYGYGPLTGDFGPPEIIPGAAPSEMFRSMEAIGRQAGLALGKQAAQADLERQIAEAGKDDPPGASDVPKPG